MEVNSIYEFKMHSETIGQTKRCYWAKYYKYREKAKKLLRCLIGHFSFHVIPLRSL